MNHSAHKDILLRQAFNCPSCQTEIHYGISLKLSRLIELATFLEQMAITGQSPKEQVEDYYRTNACACPRCGEGVQLKFRLEFVGAEQAEVSDPKRLRVGPALTSRTITHEMMQELTMLRREGVIDAYAQAWNKQSPESGQKVFDRSILRWLQNAESRALDPFFYDDYAREFNTSPESIEFYYHNHLYGVVVNGSLRWFVPMRLMKTPPAAKNGGAVKAIPTTGQEYLHWKRTKFGYIVGNGEFFKEMRKRAPGDFAKATGNY